MRSDPQARPQTALARIVKQPGALLLAPHLRDYDATCAQFNWQDAAQLLDGLPDGGGLHQHSGGVIPEADYPLLYTPRGIVSYLAA